MPETIEVPSPPETRGLEPVKRSRIYLAAWIAAEKALPEQSRQLIEAHDELCHAWRDAGWPSPTPPELQAASKAVEADPLASIAFELRLKTNDEACKEWRNELSNQPKEKQNHETISAGGRVDRAGR